MKYNQPYGVSDPEAAYINGNPATGTMGSIPPAASVEYDQREIVEVIRFANAMGYVDNTGVPCAPPDNADLTQLRKAIWGMGHIGVLLAPVSLYCDPAGNDGYDGSSAVFIAGTTKGPFKTLQKALNTVALFAPGTFGATIHLSAGTFDQTSINYANVATNAHCAVSIIGSGPTTLITSAGAGGGVLAIRGANNYTLSNFAVSYTGTGLNGACIVSTNGAVTWISNVSYNGCSGPPGNGRFCACSAAAFNIGVGIIHNAPAGNSFYTATSNGQLGFSGAQINCNGYAALGGGFIQASWAGIITTLPNPEVAFTNDAGVTGRKWDVSTNAIISAFIRGGSLGSTAPGVGWPGNQAGTQSSGGQPI